MGTVNTKPSDAQAMADQIAQLKALARRLAGNLEDVCERLACLCDDEDGYDLDEQEDHKKLIREAEAAARA